MANHLLSALFEAMDHYHDDCNDARHGIQYAQECNSKCISELTWVSGVFFSPRCHKDCRCLATLKTDGINEAASNPIAKSRGYTNT